MDKKLKILEAAESEFGKFGFRKTTMDEIAKRAKMGKSTIYDYFSSKEEVFAEVIKKDTIHFESQLNESINQTEHPKEKIKNYVVTRMKHLRELKMFYSTLTDEYLEQFAFTERIRKEFAEYEIKTLKQILDEGNEADVFAVEDTIIVAKNLMILLKGLEYLFLTENTESDIEVESRQMINILFRGIEKR
jgi:AcrR family transcriptional regulator